MSSVGGAEGSVDMSKFLSEMATFKLKKVPIPEKKPPEKKTNEIQDVLRTPSPCWSQLAPVADPRLAPAEQAFKRKFAKAHDTPPPSRCALAQSDWTSPRPSTSRAPFAGSPVPLPASLRPATGPPEGSVTTVFGQAVSTDSITTAGAHQYQLRAPLETEATRRAVSPLSASGELSAPPEPVFEPLSAESSQPAANHRPRPRPIRMSSLTALAEVEMTKDVFLGSTETSAAPPTILSPVAETETAASRLSSHRARTNPPAPNLTLTASRPITPGRKKAALLAAAARTQRTGSPGSASSSPRTSRGSPSRKRTKHSRGDSTDSASRPREISVFEDDDEDDVGKKRGLSAALAFVLPRPPKGGHKRSKSSTSAKLVAGENGVSKTQVIRTLVDGRDEEHGEFFGVGSRVPSPSAFIGLGVEPQVALAVSGTEWEKEPESEGWALKENGASGVFS